MARLTNASSTDITREDTTRSLQVVGKERVEGLIGTADRKDSFFIYGGGTVSHAFHMKHKPVHLLAHLM